MAADGLSDPDKKESTLLIVHLHHHSKLFPDIYYDWYFNHFTLMHVSREHYNVGHPQKYMGGLLHNAYQAGEESHSPKAKLPLAFVDSAVYLFPVDSCVWPYWDWTTDHEDRPALEEHFVWLSEETMPFCTDPGQPHVPPDFTLGLAEVRDWLAWDREPHGSLILRSVQSQSVLIQVLPARVLKMAPGKERTRRSIITG